MLNDGKRWLDVTVNSTRAKLQIFDVICRSLQGDPTALHDVAGSELSSPLEGSISDDDDAVFISQMASADADIMLASPKKGLQIFAWLKAIETKENAFCFVILICSMVSKMSYRVTLHIKD